ncbi:MAG: hypothetical protein V4819_16770 [Verrucomicrobiota bacterium]
MRTRDYLSLTVAMLLGGGAQTHAAFGPVETFNDLTNGAIGGQNGWVVTAGDVTTSTVIADPSVAANKVLRHLGINDANKLLPTAIPDASGGTLFYRLYLGASANDVSFGLSDQSPPSLTDFNTFKVQNAVPAGASFRARDFDTTRTLFTMTSGVWYNFWCVTDTTTDTYRIYVQRDGDPSYSTRTELASSDGTWNFRSGANANPLRSFAILSNNANTNILLDDIYVDPTFIPNLANPVLETDPDVDDDNLEDKWEIYYFGNIAAHDGSAGATNIDNDGLTNEEEETLGTNPTLADTDGDGLNDLPEDSGTGNLYAPGTRTNPLDADSDDDGANDGQEVNGTLNVAFANAPTNPNAADTDSDGWNDRVEFIYATNPNDSGATPDVHELIGLNKRNGGFELINNGVVNAVNITTGWDVVANNVDNWTNWQPPATTFAASGVQAGGTAGMRAYVQNGSATYNMTNYVAKAGNVLRLTYNRMAGGTLTANFIVDGSDLALGIIEVPTSTAQNTPDGVGKELVFKVPAGNFAVGRKIGVGFKNTVAGNPGVDNVVLTVIDADSDADGLSDFWEDQYFGNNDDNPQAAELIVATGNGAGGGSANNDGDAFDNLAEQAAGSSPVNAASTPDDLDADGLADTWESTYFGNITAQNGTGDPDGDFNNNEAEETASSDPIDAGNWPDSEPDTLNDGWEKFFFAGSLAQTAGGDPDLDGFSNLQEMQAGSHPNDITWSPSVPKLAHRWSFNGSLSDSVGASNATILNDTPASLGLSNTLSGTDLTLGGGVKATSDWAQLGTNLLGGKMTPVTIELWATQNAVQTWSRIFDFHASTTEHFFMSWTQAATLETDRVSWLDAATPPPVDNTNAPYVLGTKYHIMMTITPAVNSGGALNSGSTVSWYTRGAANGLFGPAKGTFNSANTLATLNDAINSLGRSPYADNIASATYDEVRIWDGALPVGARETLHAAGPNNASLADTDADGLYDAWELAFFPNLATATGNGNGGGSLNNDADAATNLDEQANGSNPAVAASVPGDVDGDTLSDAWELIHFADLDELPGGDPDGDYDTNSVEEDNGTLPNSKASFFSATADTISDSWKTFYGISSETSASDLDEGTGDGLTNVNEFAANTNPTLKDTDGDGLNDGPEITAGSNPLVQDTDGDGLLDGAEVNTHSSNPLLKDTDGDGFEDKYEVDHGSLPNDATSIPIQPAGFTKVEDFEGAGMTLGQTFNGVNGWVTTDPANTTVVADPGNVGNKVGQWVNGTMTKPLIPLILPIAQGNTGTVFFQLYQASNATNHSIGLSDVASPVPFGDYEAQFASIAGLFVRDAGVAVDTTYDPQIMQWMNVWIVTNNSSDTVKVFVESPLAQTGVIEITAALGPYDFRNGLATNALVSLLFAENIGDVQVLLDNIYVDPVAENLTNPATVAGDSDNDGMADTWETTYGLTVGVNDSAGDLDNDGTNNLTEFRLGLIPNSGSSRFAVGTTQATPGSFTLTWPSKTGVTFKIERSPSLASGSWITLQPTYPGTAGTTTYNDATAPPGSAFYKVTLNP